MGVYMKNSENESKDQQVEYAEKVKCYYGIWKEINGKREYLEVQSTPKTPEEKKALMQKKIRRLAENYSKPESTLEFFRTDGFSAQQKRTSLLKVADSFDSSKNIQLDYKDLAVLLQQNGLKGNSNKESATCKFFHKNVHLWPDSFIKFYEDSRKNSAMFWYYEPYSKLLEKYPLDTSDTSETATFPVKNKSTESISNTEEDVEFVDDRFYTLA